jgi:hypothetical protein
MAEKSAEGGGYITTGGKDPERDETPVVPARKNPYNSFCLLSAPLSIVTCLGGRL